MTDASKDTIYIDVDDEITNIIDKVKGSDKNIVALVLPKRAAVLQSIVNMKLLKRTADSTKKKVVLITSETGLMPLAGATGMYVAKNLQTMPEVPDTPDTSPADDDNVIDGGELGDGDKEKTVGELAGTTAVAASKADKSKKSDKKAKGKKDGKFKIPNFEKFRLRIFLIGLGVIGLFVLLYWAFFLAPSAKITVFTDTSTVNESFSFTASSDADSLDVEDEIVPAKTAETEKVESKEVAATGTKDVGNKATGTINMTAKNCSGITAPKGVDSGWAVTSGGLTYITQKQASFSFDEIDGGCVIFTSSAPITAQKSGNQYNTNNGSFSITDRSGITASGSASGGTSKEVKVVSQSDVNRAKEDLAKSDDEAVKSELAKELEDDGYFVLSESFTASDAEVSSSPNVGSEASQTTVTVTKKYTLTGVNKDDLEKLISEKAKDDIDTEKQQIVNTGIDEATFTIDGDKVTIDTIAVVGPTFDVAAVTDQIKGKKRSEVETIILQNPDVKEVQVDYSPFWVSNTPKKTSKVQIVFEDTTESDE